MVLVLVNWLFLSAARVTSNQGPKPPSQKQSRAHYAGKKMDLSDFKQDLDKVEDGVWVPFGNETRIKIAEWLNESHSRFLKAVYKKNKRAIDLAIMSDDQANELMADQWQYVVKDWEGIEIDGEPLAYSPRTVNDLARNPQYKKFFAALEDIAKDQAMFKAEVADELGKS